MKISENDIELLDKYLLNSLSKEDKVAFEKRKSESALLSEEAALQKSMIASIKIDDRNQLKQELKQEAYKLRPESVRHKKSYLRYYVAACISILLVTLFILLPSTNSLFNEYYTPFPESPIVRSNSDISNYDQAMRYYSVGNYRQAIMTLKQVTDIGLRNEVSLYLGNSHLSLNEPEKALEYFIQILSSTGNEQIKMQAQWFMALSYLKMNNKEKAKGLLMHIEKSNSTYQEKAKNLQRELNWALY